MLIRASHLLTYGREPATAARGAALAFKMSAPLAAKAAPPKPAPITIFNNGTLPQNRADVSPPLSSFGGCAGTK